MYLKIYFRKLTCWFVGPPEPCLEKIRYIKKVNKLETVNLKLKHYCNFFVSNLANR